MEKRVYNFSAGPAALPLPVLEEAQRDLVCYPGAGMSVMEMSHRSKWFDEIIETAEANVRNLLSVPETHKVLFLHGGASLQFTMIPMSFLKDTGKRANYIHTGSWGKKAIKEAQRQGEVKVLWDGSGDNYIRTPANDELNVDADAAYVHFTSNETIQGVQFPTEPETGDVPLISDSSSDIFSRPIPIERYGLLYAGAQKNCGPSGVVVVIIREDLLAKAPEGLPSMLDYNVMVKGGSRYNTPPAFGIYMIGLVTKWLLNEIGGLDKMCEINTRKSGLLYDVVDQSGGFYEGHANTESRSIMNVAFRLGDPDLTPEFLAEAGKVGLCELKGHRSVGGCRASIYNAMPEEGVEKLAAFMKEFQQSRAG